MKHRAFTGLLCCVLLAAIAVPVLSFEDPFDENRRKAEESIDDVWEKVSHAIGQRKEPGGLENALAALNEFEAVYEAAKPSKLDMWEARHRLLEIIHDSDDETVYDLYLTVTNYIRDLEELTEMAEKTRERLERAKEIRQLRGVDVVPNN